jgi:hypothetical protein
MREEAWGSQLLLRGMREEAWGRQLLLRRASSSLLLQRSASSSQLLLRRIWKASHIVVGCRREVSIWLSLEFLLPKGKITVAGGLWAGAAALGYFLHEPPANIEVYIRHCSLKVCFQKTIPE